MAALLDLLDCNVQLWNGDHHLQSPGYALLDGGEYRFGQAARSAARLRPRDINTRYWWQLSMEPLQPALGPARHTGDLVHAHLQSLYREGGEPGEAILAVPGSMQREQLSLLLGIVQQCPFDAVGLVNRSVALGSLFGGTGALFHVEIQLHQGVLIELAAGDAWSRSLLPRSSARPGSTRGARRRQSSNCTTRCRTPCATSPRPRRPISRSMVTARGSARLNWRVPGSACLTPWKEHWTPAIAPLHWLPTLWRA
jgi:hypothetical protein